MSTADSHTEGTVPMQQSVFGVRRCAEILRKLTTSQWINLQMSSSLDGLLEVAFERHILTLALWPFLSLPSHPLLPVSLPFSFPLFICFSFCPSRVEYFLL